MNTISNWSQNINKTISINQVIENIDQETTAMLEVSEKDVSCFTYVFLHLYLKIGLSYIKIGYDDLYTFGNVFSYQII